MAKSTDRPVRLRRHRSVRVACALLVVAIVPHCASASHGLPADAAVDSPRARDGDTAALDSIAPGTDVPDRGDDASDGGSVFTCVASNGRPLRVGQAEYDHCNTGVCLADGRITSTERGCDAGAPDRGDAASGTAPTCETWAAGCVYVDPGCAARGDLVDQDVALCFMSAMVPYCGCDGVTFFDYPCARRPFAHWEACDAGSAGN